MADHLHKKLFTEEKIRPKVVQAFVKAVENGFIV